MHYSFHVNFQDAFERIAQQWATGKGVTFQPHFQPLYDSHYEVSTIPVPELDDCLGVPRRTARQPPSVQHRHQRQATFSQQEHLGSVMNNFTSHRGWNGQNSGVSSHHLRMTPDINPVTASPYLGRREMSRRYPRRPMGPAGARGHFEPPDMDPDDEYYYNEDDNGFGDAPTAELSAQPEVRELPTEPHERQPPPRRQTMDGSLPSANQPWNSQGHRQPVDTSQMNKPKKDSRFWKRTKNGS